MLTEAALQLFSDLVRERMIPEIREAVQALAEAAARVPSVDTLSLAELVLESSHARPWTHPAGIVTHTSLLLHRWRRLTPGLLKTVESQTVTSHDLSSALVDKWAKRLVSNLLPFRAHFPVWVRLETSPNAIVHFTDIFRSARWGTLRARTLAWGRYAKAVAPPILFQEHIIADWIESQRATMKRSAPRTMHSLSTFVCARAGMENPIVSDVIKHKVRAIVEEMSTARLSKTRQAATIPMEGVAYLEDLAVSSVSTCAMILAAAFRFAAGPSTN